MARDIPVGNGNILAAFDKNYTLREFYFPHVGEENHTQGEPFRLGFWVNGQFSWVSGDWQIKQAYLDDTLVTNVSLENKSLKIKITGNDLVDFQENIYLKKLTVTNVSQEAQQVRIFFCHDFHIYGNDIGDTAAYRPELRGLLHYKSERYFFINAWANDKYGLDQFAAGNKEYKNLQGAWKDAEDGILSLNPIAQGSVDSAVALHLELKPQGTKECFYWICAGENWQEVARLNDVVMQLTPKEILNRTINYWKLWIDKEELNYDLIPEDIAGLYKKSLLILRTQVDNNGAIIAGNDSDALYFNRDTYSYMWPRDGALTAYALDLAGYSGLSRNFFSLCAKIIDKEGYFLHKYTPTMQQVYSTLWCNTSVGGLSRHEDDIYYRITDKVCGNPWPVTTLWLAQYYIAKAQNRQELDEALGVLRWACKYALPSGVLAEQINPDTGLPVSVSPLTWSQATFVLSVQEYINKLLEIEKCTACNQSKYSKKRKG